MVSHRSLAGYQPTLCYVTDRNALSAIGSQSAINRILDRILIAAEAGVDWIQLREKDLSTRELFTLSRDAIRIAEKASRGTRVIVNGRLDVAVAAGAAGVHLGVESMGASAVVHWCRSGNAPPGFLIGVSCHHIDEALQAERAGANYVVFGPVYDTPSKRLFGSPQGIARLSSVCRAVRIPVIAIGGLNGKNAAEALKTGATGIAAIRLFQQAKDVVSLKTVIDLLHRLPRE
jgi:thiamine-phosphate pyrophosphorylase